MLLTVGGKINNCTKIQFYSQDSDLNGRSMSVAQKGGKSVRRSASVGFNFA